MARDHRKLRVFQQADALVLEVYRVRRSFPTKNVWPAVAASSRRVSAASNIVEGSARRTTREYVNFLNIANGSDRSKRSTSIDVAGRLGFLPVHCRRRKLSVRVSGG